MTTQTPESAALPSKKKGEPKKFWLTIARILALLAVIALTVFIYSIRNQAENLARFGYPGIFLIAFMAYATVLLPAPGLAVIFAMGGVLDPGMIALVAGAGGALGEVSGYITGLSGQVVIERMDLYERFSRWMTRNGFLTVLILAALPNPFFDVAGVAAGALKMPFRRFFTAVWIGVTLKMFFFAWLGSTSLAWIFNLP